MPRKCISTEKPLKKLPNLPFPPAVRPTPNPLSISELIQLSAQCELRHPLCSFLTAKTDGTRLICMKIRIILGMSGAQANPSNSLNSPLPTSALGNYSDETFCSKGDQAKYELHDDSKFVNNFKLHALTQRSPIWQENACK